ncbi:hypothetical protein ACLB2K_065493 [Fragaria x ananassa]
MWDNVTAVAPATKLSRASRSRSRPKVLLLTSGLAHPAHGWELWGGIGGRGHAGYLLVYGLGRLFHAQPTTAWSSNSPGMLVSFSCMACYAKHMAMCIRVRAERLHNYRNEWRRGRGHLAFFLVITSRGRLALGGDGLRASGGSQYSTLTIVQYWKTNTVEFLLSGLHFANEVAASLDGNFVLVSQTTSKNILRYWVRGPRIGQSEIFASTQGYPDNIRGNINGEFWVAENSGGIGKATKFDANGNLMEAIDGLNPISQAQQFRGSLWIGSIVNHFVGIVHHIP